MEQFSRTYSVPLDPDLGCKRVVIELSVPALPDAGACFAEHVHREGQATDTVIAVTRGAALVSEDLGASWESMPVPALGDVSFRNSFTTAGGMHLLQGQTSSDGEPAGGHGHAPIALLDADWELVDCVAPALSIWHGTRSIDEADGTIVYAEYPVSPPRHESRLLRSTDEGRTWQTTLQVGSRTIRHFHTVAADPWRAGRWWASSGDGPPQCRIWESLDDGVSWSQIPVELPTEEIHPREKHLVQSVLRYTDIAVRETDVIWGTDDYLGEWNLHDQDVAVGRRTGARLFRSPKESPWRPTSIAYVGDMVRSLIDVGPAYLVATQAKGPLGYLPKMFLLWKQEPFPLTPLFAVDNFRQESPATGFTYSRASRSTQDGVFFTYRAATDAFPAGPRILRWRIIFD
jgi:hypothetical protein